MHAAQRNIEERIDALRSQFHLQRQTSITTELLDIRLAPVGLHRGRHLVDVGGDRDRALERVRAAARKELAAALQRPEGASCRVPGGDHEEPRRPPRLERPAEDPLVEGARPLRTLFLRPSLSRGRLPRTCAALGVSTLVRALVLHAAERNTLRRGRPADRRLARVIVDQLATLPHEPLRLPTPGDARARAAAQHIQRRPEDRLATVARAAGASVRTLERAFQRETGMPLGRWRRRARMLAALRLLADGLDVTAVALDVGYQTPSGFVAAFRREMGVTPAKYFGARPSGARERTPSPGQRDRDD